MYSVSNAYKQNMKQPIQRFGIRGTIGSNTFTADNIIGGTFSITNSCADNDEIILGAAYIGELRATFRNININRYEWIGKTIRPIHQRIIPPATVGGDPTTEEVPLGVYTIAEATWSAEGVSVVAYDNMSKLDKAAAFNSTSGTAYGILTAICTECGLTLGMTQSEVEALPNGTQLFGCYPENDIETYRDMIAWLAQALASVVLVNRAGEIVLKTYGMDEVDTITSSNRFDTSSFSGYETRYSGVSVVDIASKQTRYYGTDYDVYLTMNLGSNPFLQYGTKSTKETMARAILDSIAAVAYVPFNATMLGDPAYDLTDVLIQSGGIGDADKAFCIQRFSWSLSNGYNAEGVGKDPDLANAKSKSDKQIQGLLNSTSQNLVQYYFYENAEQIVVNDTATFRIIDLRFSSLKATVVMFQAEILLETDVDDVTGRITYYTNGAEVTTYHPEEKWIDGKHVLHLMWHIRIGEAQLTRFVATITAGGGSITIPPRGVQAVVSGQGLAASGDFDGFIDIDETIAPLNFTSLQVRQFTPTVTIDTQTPEKPSGTETLSAYTLGGLTLQGFTDALFVNKDALSNYTHEQLTPYTYEDLANSFIYG